MYGTDQHDQGVFLFLFFYGTPKRYLIEHYYPFGLSLGARLLYLRAYSSRVSRLLVKERRTLAQGTT
jgi:hypothetical protein